MEQGGKIVGGLLSQMLKATPLQYRHMLGNVTDQRRLVLFAAVGTGARYGESVSTSRRSSGT